MKIFRLRRRTSRDTECSGAARTVVDNTIAELERVSTADLFQREGRQIDMVVGADSIAVARTIEIDREPDGSARVVVFAHCDHETERKPIIRGFWK